MTTTVIELRSSRRYEPSFLDRMVMRASLMTLMWARHHSERTASARELRVTRALEVREFASSYSEPLSVTSRHSWPTPR